MHAREVTLHDLNVIHDGSDLQGPLRIHLHVSVPRFIFRYHTLRDQIARLNLAAEGDEGEQLVAYDHREFLESGRPARHNHMIFAETEEYHDEQEEPEGAVQDYEEQQHEETPEAQTANYTEDPATETHQAPSGLPQDPATGDNSESASGDHQDAEPNKNDQTIENYPEGASTNTDNISSPHDEEPPVQHEAQDENGTVHPDHAESTEHEQPTESVDYSEQCIEETQDGAASDLPEELVLEYPEDADSDAKFAESGDADSSLQQTADQELRNTPEATDVAGSLTALMSDESHGTEEGMPQFYCFIKTLN